MKVSQSDIFGNHAITFTAPPYDNPQAINEANNGNDIEVNISVTIRDSTYESNCVKFYYVKEYRNLKRPYSEVDSEPSTHNARPNIISRDSYSAMQTALQMDRLHIGDRKVTVQNGIDTINDMVTQGDETDLGKWQIQVTQYFFFFFPSATYRLPCLKCVLEICKTCLREFCQPVQGVSVGGHL